VIALKLKQILQPAGEVVTKVYFPGGGFVCVLVVLEDGRMIEVATIGHEGLIGAAAALANMPAMSATVVQGDSDLCYSMTADAFRKEMAKGGAFHDVMTRYSHAAAGALMQASMCNAVHSVEQRLARWLLLAHDRMDRKAFALTQEFAAMMLGASRPTVTMVAGGLQAGGLIAYHRGRVTILNRAGLELAACECYRATTRLLDGH